MGENEIAQWVDVIWRSQNYNYVNYVEFLQIAPIAECIVFTTRMLKFEKKRDKTYP
jgi:hypothetical protein